jgi:RHS repeat-associated protein
MGFYYQGALRWACGFDNPNKAAALLASGVYAVEPVRHSDPNMPGLPGQTDEYWAKLREEQRAAKQAAQQQEAVSEEGTFFYTGKPYDADLGYVFKFRNYNPEIQRWMVQDMSGFPDGANNLSYSSMPLCELDPLGLVVTIYSFEQAVEYYKRENGSASDTVMLGDNVIANIKNSSAYKNNLQRLQTAVENQLMGVNKNASLGIELRDQKGLALGFVDAVIGRSSVYYSVMTPWAGSSWSGDPLSRTVSGYATMFCSVNEVWDFESHEGDGWFTDLLVEKFPGVVIGTGTPFNLVANFQDGFSVSVTQYE